MSSYKHVRVRLSTRICGLFLRPALDVSHGRVPHKAMTTIHLSASGLIEEVRKRINAGEWTRAGLARAANLHPNTLRAAASEVWSPHSSTLIALEPVLFPERRVPPPSRNTESHHDPH